MPLSHFVPASPSPSPRPQVCSLRLRLFEVTFNKTCFSSNPRLSGGAHARRGKGVEQEGAKHVYSCCLCTSRNKCSGTTGGRNTIHSKHRFLSIPVSLRPRPPNLPVMLTCGWTAEFIRGLSGHIWEQRRRRRRGSREVSQLHAVMCFVCRAEFFGHCLLRTGDPENNLQTILLGTERMDQRGVQVESRKSFSWQLGNPNTQYSRSQLMRPSLGRERK